MTNQPQPELDEILKESFGKTVTIREITEGEKMRHHPYWVYVNGKLFCFEFNFTEVKQAIEAHTDRKVAEALEASRDIARDVDYRNLPIGTKLKSKRTGNTVEVVDRAFYYGLRHHFDTVDNRKEQEDYSSNHWEDVKGWFDVTEVPKNNSAAHPRH